MIENNTHISIIIPAFNSEKFIRETLESLYIQGYEHWEGLIIDDGSNDKTELIVQDFVHKDKRFKYHKRSDEYNSGGNGARNQGVALALYPNLMFLDSDDLVLPNCLENRMKFINDRGPGDLFVFHTGSFYKVLGDSDICWNKVTPKESNHELIIRFLNQDMPWCTNGVVWNTDFLKRIGGWNEELGAWQDWELHLRALIDNPKVIINENLPDNFYRRNVEDSIASRRGEWHYVKSIAKAIQCIESLTAKTPYFNSLQKPMKFLIYRALINYPIKLENKNVPLKVIQEGLSFKTVSKYKISFHILF